MTLLANIADVVVLILFLVCGLGMGRRGLGLLGIKPVGAVETATLALAWGLGVFALLGAAMGFIGFLRSEIAWFVFIGVFALAVRPALAVLLDPIGRAHV